MLLTFFSQMDKSLLLRALQFCLDRVMEEPIAQDFGCTLLVDMQDCRFSNISTSAAKRIIKLIQVRLKVVYLAQRSDDVY